MNRERIPSELIGKYLFTSVMAFFAFNEAVENFSNTAAEEAVLLSKIIVAQERNTAALEKQGTTLEMIAKDMATKDVEQDQMILRHGYEIQALKEHTHLNGSLPR